MVDDDPNVPPRYENISIFEGVSSWLGIPPIDRILPPGDINFNYICPISLRGEICPWKKRGFCSGILTQVRHDTSRSHVVVDMLPETRHRGYEEFHYSLIPITTSGALLSYSYIYRNSRENPGTFLSIKNLWANNKFPSNILRHLNSVSDPLASRTTINLTSIDQTRIDETSEIHLRKQYLQIDSPGFLNSIKGATHYKQYGRQIEVGSYADQGYGCDICGVQMPGVCFPEPEEDEDDEYEFTFKRPQCYSRLADQCFECEVCGVQMPGICFPEPEEDESDEYDFTSKRPQCYGYLADEAALDDFLF